MYTFKTLHTILGTFVGSLKPTHELSQEFYTEFMSLGSSKCRLRLTFENSLSITRITVLPYQCQRKDAEGSEMCQPEIYKTRKKKGDSKKLPLIYL